MSTPSPVPKFRVGVFFPGPVQLLDMACVDIFVILSKAYLQPASDALLHLPQELLDASPDIEFAYVAGAGYAADRPVELPGKLRVLPSHGIDDAAVAPGTLDVLLVPGPDPAAQFPRESLEWLARHGERADKTAVLSVCTGIFPCGQAGLLRGKEACGPRGVQHLVQHQFGDQGVKLVGHKWRWTQDGNLWSSGSVTNGNDMVAAYLRQEKRFPPALVEVALGMADVGDRPREYGEEKLAEGHTDKTFWNSLIRN